MRERSEHSLSNTKSSIAADTHPVKVVRFGRGQNRAWTLGTGPDGCPSSDASPSLDTQCGYQNGMQLSVLLRCVPGQCLKSA
jgi:hypothetical protein